MDGFKVSRVSRPDPDVERRASGNGEVITRKMTPEDLAKFDDIKPIRNSDGRVMRRPVTIPERKKEEEADMPFTKEEYFDLRIEGNGRIAIGKEHFNGNVNRLYEVLGEWGIRDMAVEEKEIFKYRARKMGWIEGGDEVLRLRNKLNQKEELIRSLEEQNRRMRMFLGWPV